MRQLRASSFGVRTGTGRGPSARSAGHAIYHRRLIEVMRNYGRLG
jgi:hypothetical protein